MPKVGMPEVRVCWYVHVLLILVATIVKNKNTINYG
jgi:hypothetical protein